jgi:hypothetical protein
VDGRFPVNQATSQDIDGSANGAKESAAMTTNATNTKSGGEASSPSLFQSVMSSLCISLGMCTFYVCGANTNQGRILQLNCQPLVMIIDALLNEIFICALTHHQAKEVKPKKIDKKRWMQHFWVE